MPVPGIHRLSALKRLLPHAEGLVVHRPDDATAGALVALELPAARVTVALTDEAWRGFSGEGSLLGQLAGERAIEDAEWISAVLAFEPVIDVAHLARETGLDDARVHAGLAVLAASGRVGWDPHERAYFHRELPDDPDRVTRDNPRLTAARQLVAARAVRPHDGGFVVGSGEAEYAVAQDVLPRWANRVLDVAVLHQEILAEATRRGHVPSEAWAGVHELAARKGSGRPGRWRACCHLRESPLRLAASPRGVAGPAVRFRRARPSRAASTPRVEQLVKSARMMG